MGECKSRGLLNCGGEDPNVKLKLVRSQSLPPANKQVKMDEECESVHVHLLV